MSSPNMKKITICGFGLIGGCLALDFLHGKSKVKVYAFDWPNVLKRLSKDNRFRVTCEPKFEQAVSNADIIVLSAPHKANEQMLLRLAKMLSLHNCLIIDTGAVKQPIAKLAVRLAFGEGTQFMPTHPMAGKEKAGFENSDAKLFVHHSWFIDESVKLTNFNKAKLDWTTIKLGAEATYINNRLHDELMSEISHLPQLISTILGGQVNPNLIPLAGPGLRSMLRLAGSPYSVWSEIIEQNKTDIIKSLKLFRHNLGKVTRMIETGQPLAGVFNAASRSYKCL